MISAQTAQTELERYVQHIENILSVAGFGLPTIQMYILIKQMFDRGNSVETTISLILERASATHR